MMQKGPRFQTFVSLLFGLALKKWRKTGARSNLFTNKALLFAQCARAMVHKSTNNSEMQGENGERCVQFLKL